MSSVMKAVTKVIYSHDPDTTSNDLQDLVPMGDSLNYTNDDCQTAHGDSDGVHEEGVVPGLYVSGSSESKWT